MATNASTISGKIVDVVNNRIFSGEIYIENGKIKGIRETVKADKQYLVPGLVDAHVHIESSMLIPSEFARLAVVHGTVATVSDPHEIANVTGLEGVDFMIQNGKKVPFYFNFGAPSCVPATTFETAGAHLGPKEVENLLSRGEILYLSEMMNYPGVIYNDAEVMEKIKIAHKYNKPVDGHAPGLRGEDLKKYIAAGISTDHECFTKEEALEKIQLGMKVIIREGSAAKNFNALIELIADYPEMIMFCSDDKHPDSLVKNHIDELVRRAIIYDFKPMDVLRAATLNPVKHYKLKNGLLRQGDNADFIVVNNLEEFQVLKTYIRGQKVAEKGKTLIESVSSKTINNFNRSYIGPDDLALEPGSNKIRVIEAIDGQLITTESHHETFVVNGNVCSDPERDILKMVVVNRYHNNPPAIAFVKNTGIKTGAIASTVAHDSHNIIAIGADDESISRAVNLLIDSRGGISLVNDFDKFELPLPVAGLMSTDDGYKVADQYEMMDREAKNLGSKLSSPYMTLSFLALLVIPQLKLSDKGLFDGSKFRFADVFV